MRGAVSEGFHQPHGVAVGQVEAGPAALAGGDGHDGRIVVAAEELQGRRRQHFTQPRSSRAASLRVISSVQKPHRDWPSSSLRGTPNCPARVAEQASRRWVRSHTRCTARGLSFTSRARAWSAAALRLAASSCSRRTRSAGSMACWPFSQREMLDCATPNSSAACCCLTRCNRRQRLRARPRWGR